MTQRSASAAKDIKGLIITSGEQVRNGVALVGETGQALQEILAQVQEVLAQVQEVHTNVSAIVEASREQSVGLREINQAVNAMDQTTQQNAAMVEESTAASHAMAREADTLHELIRRFRLTGNTPSIHQKAPASSPSQLHVVARTMRAH